MPSRPYKRLPGRSRRFLNASTLWEAEDVLLLVESHFVSETYRRFHWSDIQAFVICKSKTGMIINIVCGVLTLLFCLPIVFAGETVPGVPITFGFLATVTLILGVVNVLRGPTCRCMVRTAVQIQELRSLNRLSTARKVIERLRPRIEAAQQVNS
jgi:hypothetical protein